MCVSVTKPSPDSLTRVRHHEWIQSDPKKGEGYFRLKEGNQTCGALRQEAKPDNYLQTPGYVNEINPSLFCVTVSDDSLMFATIPCKRKPGVAD